jgi:hypothetical protein
MLSAAWLGMNNFGKFICTSEYFHIMQTVLAPTSLVGKVENFFAINYYCTDQHKKAALAHTTHIIQHTIEPYH